MKTITLIISFLFLLNSNLIIAGKHSDSPVNKTSESSELEIKKLSPIPPKEADFNDTFFTEVPSVIEFSPVTPKEATFEDSDPDPVTNEIQYFIRTVPPLTPREASFENDYFQQGIR
jgi:hypothetical protein